MGLRLLAAGHGFSAATEELAKAGADLEAAGTAALEGFTASRGCVQRALGGDERAARGWRQSQQPWTGRIDADVADDCGGDVDAVKLLLRAKANPQLSGTKSGVALNVAARNGYPEVVRELIGQVGIEGCGGASSGTRALELAVVDQHLDIVAMLTDAGVVYTGAALRRAAGFGREACVKFLLQHHHQDNAVRRRAFVNYRDEDGTTPLLCGIGFPYFVSPSPRIVRMLVDAGADTTSPLPLTNSEGRVEFVDTPLSLASRIIRGMDKDGGGDEGEDLLHRLEAIRRVLLRFEAVHAASWLWQSHPRYVAEGASTTKATSASLARMLPLLRKRARRHGVSWATLFRWVVALWC